MLNFLKKIVKYSLNILSIIPISERKVFFLSFDGTQYGFDSKAMAEFILNNYPDKYELYWGTKDGILSGCKNNKIHLTKIKSVKGIYHMMTSKVLIYNINPPLYIPFRKNQLLINTWHGFAYKKVGKYAVNFDARQFNTSTCFLSHSKTYTDDVIKDSFQYKGEILNIGAPRNDVLFKNDLELKNRIKEELNLIGKKIALFAPTFRGDFEFEECGIDFERLKEALSKRFGGDWLVLCRLHPMIAKKYKANCINAVDVSQYPDMQELLLVTDVLLTDYSSSMWDFSLMGREVFLFATDIDNYIEKRGFYHHPQEWPFPLAKNNNELVDAIANFDKEIYDQKLCSYLKFVGNYENGDACEKLMKYINSKMQEG